MPPKGLKTMAKKVGKSLADAERYWRDAKKQYAKRLRGKGKKPTDKYRYIMGIVKKRLKWRENEDWLLVQFFEQRGDLKGDELAGFLDASIRNNARWNIPKDVFDIYTNEINRKALNKVSQRIYDNIVSDYAHNDLLLKAARSVKLDLAHVRKIIRRALRAGYFDRMESRMLQVARGVIEKGRDG